MSKKLPIVEGLVDAQEMNRLHPKTFQVPPLEELDALTCKDYVQVGNGNERFWLLIESIDHEHDEILGIIDNDLLNTSKYDAGYLIAVRKFHVHKIIKEQDEKGEGGFKFFSA